MQAHDLQAALSKEQKQLLRVTVEPMLAYGRWPHWNYVQAMMDSSLDAEEILRSMPSVGSFDFGHLQYGLVWYDHRNLSADSTVRLTIAASRHISEYRPIGDLFASVLQYLVALVEKHKPSPYGDERVTVASTLLPQISKRFNEHFVKIFPELLHYEPFTLAGFQSVGDSGWLMELTRVLLRFKGVTTLDEYVQRVVQLVEVDNRSHELKMKGSSADADTGGSGSADGSQIENGISGTVSGNVAQVGIVNGDVYLYGDSR